MNKQDKVQFYLKFPCRFSACTEVCLGQVHYLTPVSAGDKN